MAARRASVRLLKVLQQSANGQPTTLDSCPVVGCSSLPAAQVKAFNVESSVCRPGSISFRRLYAADGQPARDTDHHEHEKAKMTSEGGGTEQHFGEAKESIKAEGQKVADKATDYTKNAKESMSSGMEQSKEKGKESFETVSDKTKETMGGMADKARSAVDKTKDTVGSGSEKAREEAEKAKNMMNEKTEEGKGVVGSMKERASKEVDTAKDMFKDIPQKTSETAQGLKEVVTEAAKAVKRDAEKVAEKVGLKSEEKKH